MKHMHTSSRRIYPLNSTTPLNRRAFTPLDGARREPYQTQHHLFYGFDLEILFEIRPKYDIVPKWELLYESDLY
jgi:hypothetical protein